MPSTFAFSTGAPNCRRLFSAGIQTQKLCLGFSQCHIPHLPSLHLDFLPKILPVCGISVVLFVTPTHQLKKRIFSTIQTPGCSFPAVWPGLFFGLAVVGFESFQCINELGSCVLEGGICLGRFSSSAFCHIVLMKAAKRPAYVLPGFSGHKKGSEMLGCAGCCCMKC